MGNNIKVAMMQPACLPWQGFFELIYKSDIFILLDDFQFSVQSHHQRNKLFVNKGQVGWYTTPVLKSVSFQLPLNQVQINEADQWRHKMRRRIETNYARAPYYPQVAPVMLNWIETKSGSLGAQNIALITAICALLGPGPEFRMSSSFKTGSKRSERVLELLRWCGADEYYSARGSFGYMKEDAVFPVEGITVMFQNFVPAPYDQKTLSNEFVPYLSIVDALMNIGPAKTMELVKNGTTKWLSWKDMEKEHKGAE